MLEQINNSFKEIGQTSTQLNRKGLSYAIATQITQLERSFLLEQLAEYLRKKIAQNGYKKTKTYFNYPDRIESMFHIAELV